MYHWLRLLPAGSRPLRRGRCWFKNPPTRIASRLAAGQLRFCLLFAREVLFCPFSVGRKEWNPCDSNRSDKVTENQGMKACLPVGGNQGVSFALSHSLGRLWTRQIQRCKWEVLLVLEGWSTEDRRAGHSPETPQNPRLAHCGRKLIMSWAFGVQSGDTRWQMPFTLTHQICKAIGDKEEKSIDNKSWE